MNVAFAPGGAISRADRDVLDHEIRAALFGIEASAEAVSRHRHRMTESQIDVLARGLAAEVRRVRALLEGRTASPVTFDLAEVIEPVVACARASGMDVHCSVPAGVTVHGDRDATAQVVVGLLDNARKHAPSSPVEVRANELCGLTALYVEDRGSGIASPFRERVFERDVRGEDSTGSGLGLYVARRLMVRQGGSIAVRSRPRGGSTFVLHFPRASSGACGRQRQGRMRCACSR